MRSILYSEHDFSEFSIAEVVARTRHVAVEAIDVPGRAGSVVLSRYIPPIDVTVQLLLDIGYNPGAVGLAKLRDRVHGWLIWPGGGNLILPDNPEVEYLEVMLTSASNWSDLFETGSCELTFTLFNPIGYGIKVRTERTLSFQVGGTYETWPTFNLVASSGDFVQVKDVSSGRYVKIEHTFSGGEVVEIDCERQSATIDNADAQAKVSLGSDFFCLEPGVSCNLEINGCSTFETNYYERWA